MSEKSRELWQLTAIIAINLILLIIISYGFRADAVCLGNSGEKVAVLQKSLAKNGFYAGEINGEYNFGTRNAVKKFQKSFGIDNSGEADFNTFRALGLGARSDKCFLMETELLARYLKLCGGKDYPEMLDTAENILSASDGFTLSDIIFRNAGFSYKALLNTEPTSLSYSAALHALNNKNPNASL